MIALDKEPPFNQFIDYGESRAQLIRTNTELFNGEMLSDARLVRCRKCGKPLGYVTVVGKALLRFWLPLQNVKIIGICMECFQKDAV